LTEVTIPAQANGDHRDLAERLGDGRFPSPEAMLARSTVMLERIKGSCTLIAVNHHPHPVSGSWGVDEALFNGPIAQHLAANRHGTARSVLQESLLNPRFVNDELLVMDRAYLALRENGNVRLARALLQAPREAELQLILGRRRPRRTDDENCRMDAKAGSAERAGPRAGRKRDVAASSCRAMLGMSLLLLWLLQRPLPVVTG
jgi:hypothetical protein